VRHGKLGKLPRKPHRRTLDLRRYLVAGPSGLPTPPAKLWREYKVPKWTMAMNDTVGCCTVAAIAHMVMLMTAHTGAMVTPSDADVIAVYSAVTGYDPSQTDADGNNPTDNGAAITDVLAYWQTKGIAGDRILGWAAVGLDPAQIDLATYIFGAVDIGFNVPAFALTQFGWGFPWDLALQGDGRIVGGHSVPLFGYGRRGFDATTWGANQKLGRPFAATYMDEAYVVVTDDWVNASTGLAPNLLNRTALLADLAAMKAA
jgi:hypothetical protein